MEGLEFLHDVPCYRREVALLEVERQPLAMELEELDHEAQLLLGAFEGASYAATGYYRPQMQCLMFDRSDAYCDVCSDAVEEIIDLYSRTAR